MTKYCIDYNIIYYTCIDLYKNLFKEVSIMELSAKNIKKILLIITLSILLYSGLQNLASVISFLKSFFGLLSPLIMGLAIAFILNVPMEMLERIFFPLSKKPMMHKIRRLSCLLLSIIMVAAIIFLVAFLVIPELVDSFGIIKHTAPAFFTSVQAWAEKWSGQLPELKEWIASFQFDWDKMGSSVANFVKNGTSTVIGSAFAAVSSIFNGTVTLVMAIIFAMYILMSKEKLAHQSKRIIYAYLPEKRADRIIYVSKLSYKTFHSYVAIQFTEAVILGTLCFIGMFIFRFPYAATISVLIGFTALIPLVGAFIGAALGVFMILMISPVKALWFIVFIIVLQQIEGNLIYPRVVGSSIGLPAIWVFTAVILGGSTMGILGMMIFVPLCSVIYNLTSESVAARLASKKEQIK